MRSPPGFESKPSNWWSHRYHFAFPQGNRLLTRAVKINHSKGLPDLVYRKDPEGAFVKKYYYRGSYGSHSVPLPLIVFPAHFFFSMLFARSTQAKRHGSGRILYLYNPFRGNVQILHRLQYCLQLKNFTVPRVACKEKADPCKFLVVQKFVKGFWVLTRVGTFSVILII